GTVLRRNPRAREDGLALGEEERMLPAGGLLRDEPLQRGRVRMRCVVDREPAGTAGQVDEERRSEHRIRRTDRPGEGAAFGVADVAHVEIVDVEHEALRAGRSVDRERDAPDEPALVERDAEIERYVRDARLVRAR